MNTLQGQQHAEISRLTDNQQSLEMAENGQAVQTTIFDAKSRSSEAQKLVIVACGFVFRRQKVKFLMSFLEQHHEVSRLRRLAVVGIFPDRCKLQDLPQDSKSGKNWFATKLQKVANIEAHQTQFTFKTVPSKSMSDPTEVDRNGKDGKKGKKGLQRAR